MKKILAILTVAVFTVAACGSKPACAATKRTTRRPAAGSPAPKTTKRKSSGVVIPAAPLSTKKKKHEAEDCDAEDLAEGDDDCKFC